MGFSLKLFEDKNIPPMAWCIKIDKQKKEISAVYGQWVEAGSDFLVEGAWADDFINSDFSDSNTLMGSGAKVKDDKVIICTPCHTLEAVYSIGYNDQAYYSNSLAFLLESTSEKLDLNYLDYESDILSISEGIKNYVKEIPLFSTNKVRLYYFYNIELDYNLNSRQVEKPEPPDFTNYESYCIYLNNNFKSLLDNASNKNRKKIFKPIVFCSNGYDSALCAVLGKKYGCNEAVVYETKRPHRSDSGIEIVNKLSFNQVHQKKELDYMGYRNAEDFVATGELGTSIFFGSAEKELNGRVLLSGAHGGNVWERNGKDVNAELKRAFLPDTAKKEFRLRVGFIILAVAFMGAVKHSQIHKISNSKEMQPWILNKDYDRPIPRRVAEEAGIARKMFGYQKGGGVGSSLRFGNLYFLKKVMPASSFAQFAYYYHQTKKKRRVSLSIYLTRSLSYLIYMASIASKRRNSISLEKIFFIKKWKRQYKCSPWAPSFLFHWGIEKVSSRYKSGTKNLQR